MRKIVVWALLIVLSTLTLAQAKSLDELLRLASREALPEVRQAATWALSAAWAQSNLSDEALRRLALADPADGVRRAAARALGLRRVQSAATPDELVDLVLNGEFEASRAVAAEALSGAWLAGPTPSGEELAQMLLGTDSAPLKAALEPALARALASSPQDIRALLAQAAVVADPALQRALAGGAVAKLRASSLFAADNEAFWAAASRERVAIPGRLEGASPELRGVAGERFGQLLAQGAPDAAALEALVADPRLSPEVRAAAAPLLSKAWLNGHLTLVELEARAAGGPTPQVRAAALPALVQAYVAAVGRLELDLPTLAAAVGTAGGEVLARARAQAVFVLLRTALVGVEAQAEVEAIANGQTRAVRGVTLDGTQAAFRRAASEFLTGLYTFFGFIDRFEDPLSELTAKASDGTRTPEFRSAAGRALAVVLAADRQRAQQALQRLQGLLDQLAGTLNPWDPAAAQASLDGLRQVWEEEREALFSTAEVAGDFILRQALGSQVNRSLTALGQALERGRLLTARSQIAALQRQLAQIQLSEEAAPLITTQKLVELAGGGQTVELRRAAAQALGPRLAREGVAFEELWRWAEQGRSPELQLATVEALAAAWRAGADTLYTLSQTGNTAAVRRAAALALSRSDELAHLSLDGWRALAQGRSVPLMPLVLDGGLAGVRVAAAGALATALADGAHYSLEDLIDLSTGAPTQALQWGAANALARRLIAPSWGESDLFRLIGVHTLLFGPRPQASSALSQALSWALARRFGDVGLGGALSLGGG